MKSGYYYILLPAFIMPFLYGCKSNSAPEVTVQNTDNVNLNAQAQEDNEKLLDMALQISGKTLEHDQRGAALRMLSLNEKDLVRGLVQWLVLLDGRYPNSLDPKVSIKRADKLLVEKYGSSEQAKEHGYDIFFASAFYDKLVRENKDVVYCGDKVTPEDKDKILIRWKIEKNKYRIVFGDLHAEDVSGEKLTELET